MMKSIHLIDSCDEIKAIMKFITHNHYLEVYFSYRNHHHDESQTTDQVHHLERINHLDENYCRVHKKLGSQDPGS